jgi:hypothetical protein
MADQHHEQLVNLKIDQDEFKNNNFPEMKIFSFKQ